MPYDEDRGTTSRPEVALGGGRGGRGSRWALRLPYRSLFQWDRDSLDSILCPLLPFGFPWVGGIFSLFFLFWAVSWFFRPWGWGWGYRRRYGWWRYDGASQILRERYAKGEITKEQFEQMMRDLERHG